MHEEPDVSAWHQVALAIALFFTGLPQASRHFFDVLGGIGKSPGAVRMARLFRWTLSVWNDDRLEGCPGSAESVSGFGTIGQAGLRLC